MKSAPAFTFAAGMVSTLPAKEPMAPEFPVTALLASVHVAAVSTKDAAGVSVKVIAVPMATPLIAVGNAGVGVATAAVVIDAGAEAKLVCVNVKGPPKPPNVDFCTLTDGERVLTKVQMMFCRRPLPAAPVSDCGMETVGA